MSTGHFFLATKFVCQNVFLAQFGLTLDYKASLPVDVVVESNIVAVVIVVRLLRPNLIGASSHYNMALLQ